jgi:hypothetical protein
MISSRFERFKQIAVAANQLALSLFDVRESAETIVFQFEDVVGVVEGLSDAEAHRMYTWERRTHLLSSAYAFTGVGDFVFQTNKAFS